LIFVLIALPFGLLSVFTTPPFHVPDEHFHFYRAYQVAEGKVIASREGYLVGGRLPKSVVELANKMLGDRTYNKGLKFEKLLIERELVKELDAEQKVFTEFVSSIYFPVPYLPQALGITFGKYIDASPLFLLYAGRVANLLAAIVLTLLAIRTAPFIKWTILLLALMPMTLFQFSSLSADAVTISLAFFTFGIFLNLSMRASSPISKLELAGLFALCTLLALSKQAYVFFPFLYFLIPAKRFPSFKKYLLTFGCLITICIVATASWFYIVNSLQAKDIYISPRADLATSPHLQLKYLLANPFRFLFIFFNDFNWDEHGEDYYTQFVGLLGWLDTRLPDVLILLYYPVLLISIFIKSEPTVSFNAFNRVKIVTIAIASAMLVSLMIYLHWSPINGEVIQGLQGRYFIPLAPLILAALYVPLYDSKIVKLGIIAFTCFALTTTYKAVAERYYVEYSSNVGNHVIPTTNNNIRYSIEKIKKEQVPLLSQPTLTITGWAFVPQDESGKNEVQLVLQSRKKTYVFTTQKQIRADVTKAYKSVLYNYAGFEAYIPTSAIDTGRYEIGIWVKGKSKHAFKATGKSFDLTKTEAITKRFSEREITYAIDSISDLKEYVYLKGWAFIAGVNSGDTQTRVVLESAEGGSDFATVPTERPDVTAAYSWQHTDYNRSGFTVTIPKKNLHPNRFYRVSVLLARDSTSAVVETNKAIELNSQKTIKRIHNLPTGVPAIIAATAIPKRGITYAIDSVSNLEEHIYLKGWAFIAGVNSDSTQTRIVLESAEGGSDFATVPTERPDVAAAYSWQHTDYNRSGFTVTIPKKNLKANIYLVRISVVTENAGKLSKDTPYVLTIRQ